MAKKEQKLKEPKQPKEKKTKEPKAKKQKLVKELSLEQILWNCRNILRGKVEKADNRNAVLSLAFLKFAGDKFIARREALAAELKSEGFDDQARKTYLIIQQVMEK